MYRDASDDDVEAAKSLCREALFLTDPSVDRQNLIDKKGVLVAGTCEWIRSSKRFTSWLNGDSGLIWIIGGPAKGKTMLSIYLTQLLEHSTKAIYFFCSRKHPTRRTATAILRTLLWQILMLQPELTQLVSAHSDTLERTDADLPAPESLWELFQTVIQSPVFEGIHCLIDGLDECDVDCADWLASRFATLSDAGNDSHVHILITSRSTSSAKYHEQIFLDEKYSHHVCNDIARFTQAKTRELTQQVGISSEDHSRIQKELLSNSGGTFLWIEWAMAELLSNRSSSDVRAAVDGLASRLPTLYGPTIKRISSENLITAMAVLHWVTLAARPLSSSELTAAVATQMPGDVDKTKTAQDYVRLCEPLIFVQRSEVFLVHRSVKKYLLRQEKDMDEVAESVRASFADAHLSLAKSCLDALGKDSTLSSYAKLHWSYHVAQCSENIQTALFTENPFFTRGSSVRYDWWKSEYTRCKDEVGDQETLDFSMACYVGLKVWAETVLAAKPLRKDSCLQSMSAEMPTERQSRIRSAIAGNLSRNRARTRSILARCLSTNRRPKPKRHQTESVERVKKSQDTTALHYAVLGGSGPDIVAFLLARGADPNARDPLEDSPLAIAARWSQLDVMKLLLAHGADSNLSLGPDQGILMTPLGYAIGDGYGNLAAAALLLDSGASIHAAECADIRPDDLTLLQRAASKSSKALVALLLDHGADPLVSKNGQPSPLCLAIERGNKEVVDLLLRRTASCTKFKRLCTSWPLYTALACQRYEIAKRLICYGVTSNDSAVTTVRLWTAIINGDATDVRSELKKGVNPNIATPASSQGCPSGLTSLHWAVIQWQHRGFSVFNSQDYGAIVRKLLEHGANVDLRDARDKTALQYAGEKGIIRSEVALLIKKAKERANADASGPGCNLDLLRTGGTRVHS